VTPDWGAAQTTRIASGRRVWLGSGCCLALEPTWWFSSYLVVTSPWPTLPGFLSLDLIGQIVVRNLTTARKWRRLTPRLA
jgi:hypothetical protein